jgi:hypothetical protein
MLKLDEAVLKNSGSTQASFPFEHDERWFLVQRIITSKYFIKASQLREILLYVTSQVLLDEKIAIPEHEIACKVLGRRESFNPNDDNIVRVQAGHLRRKLDQYFLNEGREEPYVLVIPKGTYVPHFLLRQSGEVPELTLPTFSHRSDEQDSNLTPAISISTNVEREPTPIAFETRPNFDGDPSALLAKPFKGLRWKSQSLKIARWFWLLIGFGFGVAATICLYWLNPTSHPAFAAKERPRNFIEQRIFNAGAPLSIVATDSSLVLLQNTLHTDIPVSDYIGDHYPSNILAHSSNAEQRAALENATVGRYTSLGDLTIAWQVEELAQRFGASATLRYARYMSVRDFEKGNFILIGSRRGNPWISLFEPQLNFALEEDQVTHLFHFLNKNPGAGEKKIYANQQQPHGDYVSYVDIALVPNLTKTGYVLLLNGSVMDSNEAAAHLIFGGDLPESLLETFGHDIGKDAQEAEVFLRVHSLEGAPSKYDVIAVRHQRI